VPPTWDVLRGCLRRDHGFRGVLSSGPYLRNPPEVAKISRSAEPQTEQSPQIRMAGLESWVLLRTR
jgi:hypothetical protein